jgi:hypothetical protein
MRKRALLVSIVSAGSREPYVEPSYQLSGFCGVTPNWENIACVPPGDVLRQRGQECLPH